MIFIPAKAEAFAGIFLRTKKHRLGSAVQNWEAIAAVSLAALRF